MSITTTPAAQSIPGKKPARRCYRVQGIPMKWALDDIHGKFRQVFPDTIFTFTSLCKHTSGKSKTAVLSLDAALPEGSSKILLESHELAIEQCDGLTTLFEPEDGSPTTVDIIFVHGLSGHSIGSWTVEDYCWPRDALGADLRNVRIMTFGYEAKLDRDTSTSMLTDFGTTLLNELFNARAEVEHELRPIFLIGHSFGGTVIAWALNELLRRKQFEEYEKTLRAIRCVTFFGAPHMGMSIENLEPIIKDREHESMKRTLEDLRPDSELLRTLRATLADLKQIQFITCLEQKRTLAKHADGTLTGKSYQAVDANSARLHAHREKIIPIAADHRQMIKFSHAQDRHYELIRNTLKSTLDRCRGTTNLPCLNSEERDRLLASLRILDPAHNELDHREAEKDTCDWFFEAPEYRKWTSQHKATDTRPMLLCIKSPPGCGKSTLLRYALDRQKAQSTSYVAAFSFSSNGTASQRTVSEFYQSILVQMVTKVSAIPSAAISIPMRSLSPNSHWPPFALRQLLEDILSHLDKPLFCFIDSSACPPVDLSGMIKFFDRIADTCKHKEKFSILLTCGTETDLPKTVTKIMSISLDSQEDHAQDILRFAQRRLDIGQDSTSQKCWNQFRTKAQGNFLWAKLALNILERDRSRGQRREAIKKIDVLPAGLPQLCSYILDEAGRQQNKGLLLLLKSVNQSPKPPKAKEMYKVTKSTESAGSIVEYLRNHSKDHVVQSILGLSRGLLEATGHKSTNVRFVHNCIPDILERFESTENPLQKSLKTSPAQAHDQVKKDCVETLKRLNNGEVTDWDTAIYAIENVFPYANEAQRLGVSQVDFFKTFPLTEWIPLANEIASHSRFSATTGWIYILADMGLSHLIHVHPASLQSYLVPDPGMCRNPLFAAFANMNIDTISMFLKLERDRMKPTRLFSDSSMSPEDHESLCAQYVETLREARDAGVIQRILSPESSKLSDIDAVMNFMRRPGNDLLHLFLILAGRTKVDSQTFERTKRLTQVKQPLLLKYPPPHDISHTGARGITNEEFNQPTTQVQPRGLAQEYYDSFKTHPDWLSLQPTDTKVQATAKASKTSDELDMHDRRQKSGRAAKTADKGLGKKADKNLATGSEHHAKELDEHLEQGLGKRRDKKGDSKSDIHRAKAKAKEKTRQKASSHEQRKSDRKRAAVGPDSSDENDLSMKKTAFSKSKKYGSKWHTKLSKRSEHPVGVSHKGPGKQRGHAAIASLGSSARQQKPQSGHDHVPKTNSLAQSGGHQPSKLSKYHSTFWKHSVIPKIEVHSSSQQSSQQSKPQVMQNVDVHLPLEAKINDPHEQKPQAGRSTSENGNSDSETSDLEDTSLSDDSSSDGSSSHDLSSGDPDSEAEQGPLATASHQQENLKPQSSTPSSNDQKILPRSSVDSTLDGQSSIGVPQARGPEYVDSSTNHDAANPSNDNSYNTSIAPTYNFYSGSGVENWYQSFDNTLLWETSIEIVNSSSTSTSSGSDQSDDEISSSDESSSEDEDNSHSQQSKVYQENIDERTDLDADAVSSPTCTVGLGYESAEVAESSSDSSSDDTEGESEFEEDAESNDGSSDHRVDDLSDSSFDGDGGGDVTSDPDSDSDEY